MSWLSNKNKKTSDESKMDASALTDNTKFVFDHNGKPIDLTKEESGK